MVAHAERGLTQRMQVLIAPEEHRALTQLAARMGTSVGELVREAIRRTWLAPRGPETHLHLAVFESARVPVPSPDELERELDASQDRP